MKIKDICPPRLFDLVLIATGLLVLIAWVAPYQLPVSAYKLSLVTLAGVVGYYLDRRLFPYARPDGYLAHAWRSRCAALKTPSRGSSIDADHPVIAGYELIFAAVLLRRAIIIAATMTSIGLGA